MSAKAMERRYKGLRRRLDAGRMTPEAFEKAVERLRVRVPGGAWHSVASADGSWLRWDGQAWQPAPEFGSGAPLAPPTQTPRAAPRDSGAHLPSPLAGQPSKAPGGRAVGAQPVPGQFWPLFLLILGRTLKSFLRALPRAIFFSILMMLLLWAANFCIITFKNDGYAKFKPHDKALGLGFKNPIVGGVYGGIFVSIGTILLFNGIRTVRREGLGAAAAEVVALPGRIGEYFLQAGDVAWAGLLGGAGVSLVVAVALDSYASAAVAAGAFAMVFSRARQGVGMLLRAAWGSTYGTLKGARGREFGLEAGYIAALGGSVGFALRFFMPRYGALVLGVGLLVAAVYTIRGGDRRALGTASLLLAWYGLWALLDDIGASWAHDGGPWESNLPLNRWIRTPGAQRCAEIAGQQAVATGAMAGAMTMLGQGFVDALSSLGNTAGAGAGAGPTTYDDGSPLIYDENGDVVQRDENGNYIWQVGDETRRLTRDEVVEEIEENLEANRRRERESQAFQEETRRLSDQWLQRKHDEAVESQRQMEIRRALQEAEEQQRQRNRDHMIGRLNEMGQEDPDLRNEVNDLVRDGNYAGLEDLYRSRLWEQIGQGQRDSAHHRAWAQAYHAGEIVAQATVAASRGAMMVVGGPAAGIAGTALGVGAISAAQGGAESYVQGNDALEVVKDASVGFLSGAKDGAIGAYVNLPGTGAVTRVLLPAAGDVGETYLRTGDIKRSLATGAVSAVGDIAGMGIDGVGSTVTRELMSAGVSGTAGGTLSVINGGDFGEGFQQGLVNHVGGRVGSRLGQAGADSANAADYQRRLDDLDQRRQQGMDAEERVRNAIDETAQQRSQRIPTEDQPEIIRQLDDSRYQRVQVDENGHMVVDADGNPVTQDMVSTRRALEQLQDTASSRTAKQGDPDLQDAIIRTRNEEIYGPADRRTIDRAAQNPEVQSMMRPGDELVMDTFSTPGRPQSLGADRDARLTIRRPNPDSETGYDMIEVPRQHWENDAYRDFYDHSMDVMGGRQNVTPESHPEFFRRRQELDYLRGAGASQDDIDARAWGEAHNQLFTDRHHIEASRDNADQVLRPTAGGVEPGQDAPNVLRTQWGEQRPDGSARNLEDAEGYARMWGEKSRFYQHNTPEAVAQAQKGIDQHMRVRHGLRQQGIEPPPMDNRTAAAMERISRAPVGADATPQAMNQLNSDLQAMGYRDTNDAMRRIASSNEGLKWSRPEGYQPPPPAPAQGLTAGQTIAMARDASEYGPNPFEENR